MAKTIGANVTVEWVDDKTTSTYYFSFGEYDSEKDSDSFGIGDDEIFYYAKGVEELKDLMINPHEFKVIKWELVNA